MMRKFRVTAISGEVYHVDAEDRAAARREVMIQRWGRMRDAVVPHAPEYRGRGLRVELA